MRRISGFTLLELLIVIMIIAVLSSLLMATIPGIITRTRVAQARRAIDALAAAIKMYESEVGRFPRRPRPTGAGNLLFRNDIAWVYAALKNRRALGGGPSSPGIDWFPEDIGHAAATDIDNVSFMSQNPFDTVGLPWLSPLPPGERDLVNDSAFQLANLPGTASELVFLDPWGNPYVYREWASVPSSQKDGLAIPRTSRVFSTGPIENHVDRPRDPSGFDVFSPGPNGILEYGEGDDVCGWTLQR